VLLLYLCRLGRSSNTHILPDLTPSWRVDIKPQFVLTTIAKDNAAVFAKAALHTFPAVETLFASAFEKVEIFCVGGTGGKETSRIGSTSPRQFVQ